MTLRAQRHRADRVLTRLKAYCSFGRVEGTAALADISYSGALIENTTMRPEMGTRVVLHVHLKPPEAFRAATPKAAGDSELLSPRLLLKKLVELRGIEPLTLRLPVRKKGDK